MCMLLRGFLQNCKHALTSTVAKRIIAVIGNESTDTDSIVSAIVLAFAVHRRKLSFSSKLVDNNDVVVVPIINCPREDFVLKQDSYNLLKQHDIHSEHLTFLDDLDLYSLFQLKSLQLILVDHNRLDTDERLADCVCGIVDHHVDQGCYDWVQHESRIIKPVGSTCTLVAQMLLNDDEEVLTLDPAVPGLLVSTVITDTANLNSNQVKFQRDDVDIVEKFADKIEEREAILKSMLQWRTNLDGLTTDQKMRKDYKAYIPTSLSSSTSNSSGTYGMSVILCRLDRLIADDPDFLNNVRLFRERKGLFLHFVMLAFAGEEDGIFRRQLIIHSPDQALLRYLSGKCREELDESKPLFTPMEIKNSVEDGGDNQPNDTLMYTVNNNKISRKHLQPIICNWLKT